MTEKTIRGLTLTQPWATLVALGYKRIETRSWRTSYRGLIAIHAAKAFPVKAKVFAETERALGRLPTLIPRGAIIATARLINIEPTEDVQLSVSGLERHLGDFSAGRWAWFLEDVVPMEQPVPYPGRQKLWKVPHVYVEHIEFLRRL